MYYGIVQVVNSGTAQGTGALVWIFNHVLGVLT